MSDNTINVEIDGQSYSAEKGQMLIEVTDANGINVPRFCYHRKLTVAANCRMCLVEVEKAPKPLPACATPVMDGMVVRTKSPLAIEAQKSVMEFLLINHPLDCPICDQGGECELQDIAMGYGGDVSRFNERKRVVADKDIGPLIATDMTRCIHCTRCVRFGEEIAGLRELGATGRGENMKIGTYIEKSVDSELSGNVIDLCPVGALTSKPFRFRARAWEISQKPTVLAHDMLNSNISVHVNKNKVVRVVPRDNDAVNEAWLSDRDRFSYEGLNHAERLLKPRVKRDGSWVDVDWQTALDETAALLKEVQGDGLGMLINPGSTTEELYLAQALMRGLGSNNIDHRLRQGDFSDQDKAPLYPAMGVSPEELEQADVILLVGTNPRKEQPLINHRIRKAALAGAKVLSVNPFTPAANYDYADTFIGAPTAMAGFLSLINASSNDVAQQFRDILAAGERVVVLLGAIAQAADNFAALRAAAGEVAKAAHGSLGYLDAGGNATGAWLAGAVPHRGAAGGVLETAGKHAAAMLRDDMQGLVLYNVEPDMDCWDAAAAVQAVSKVPAIAFTSFSSEVLDEHTTIQLPIAPFAETSGTFMNGAGLAQSFSAVVPAPGDVRPGWKVLRVLGNLCNLKGFDYMASTEVRDELVDKIGAAACDTMDAWDTDASSGDSAELTRIGITPIYATDGVVRRSQPLQSTLDAVPVTYAAMNTATASRLGVSDGGKVEVTQTDTAVSMDACIDDSIADDCVVIPVAAGGSQYLGAAFGAVTVTAVEG